MAKSMAAALLIFSVLISVCIMVSGQGGTAVGAKTEVEDVKNNKRVQELGRFSVEEFNRMQSSRRGGNNVYGDLVFSEVIEAQEQVVAGLKYYLKVEVTTKSGDTKMFDSIVVVQPWRHSKELLNFAPSTS